MTDCPDCGTTLDTTDTYESDLIDAFWIACPDDDCGFETVLARLSYPGYDHEAISEVFDDAVCGCGDDAVWRIERNSIAADARTYCDDCVPAHSRRAYTRAVMALDG